LEDGAIEEWIVELERIRQEDPYEVEFNKKHKSNLKEKVKANRGEAAGAVAYLRCRKAANEMRKLPIAERVPKMLEAFDGQSRLEEGVSRECFRSEVIRLGREAMPYVLKRAPTNGPWAEQYGGIVAAIGGPDAVKHLMAVFHDRSNEYYIRCDAIQKLYPLENSSSTVPDLIEQLNDLTKVLANRCVTQRGYTQNEPCEFEVYPIRICTAAALCQLTGKDWGPIFYHDHRTWSAWSAAADKDKFHPFMLPRTESEIKVLAREMLNRLMTQHQTHMRENYQTPFAVQVGEQLQPLGTYGIDLVVEEFHQRAPMLRNETALENLQSWASGVLSAIDQVAGRRAAERIEEFRFEASDP